MRRVVLITALCAACSSPKAPGKGEKAKAEAPKSVATEAPKNRWLRPRDTEPDPVAKGLYRQAAESVRTGDLKRAEPLFAKILADHPESRFARRLQTEGFPIVEAAKFSTVVLMFGMGTFLFSR